MIMAGCCSFGDKRLCDVGVSVWWFCCLVSRLGAWLLGLLLTVGRVAWLRPARLTVLMSCGRLLRRRRRTDAVLRRLEDLEPTPDDLGRLIRAVAQLTQRAS